MKDEQQYWANKAHVHARKANRLMTVAAWLMGLSAAGQVVAIIVRAHG